MNDPRRVLYLSPNGYLGGAERACIDFCRVHQLYGRWNPTLLFLNPGVAVDEARKHHITTIVSPLRVRLSRPVLLGRAALWLREVVRLGQFDVIHSTMPYAHVVQGVALGGRPIKKVWYQHGPVGGSLDLLAQVFRYDWILFNSEYLETEHFGRFALQRETSNAKVLHYPIFDEQDSSFTRDDIRRRHLSAGQTTLCLCAGRMTRWKGYDQVVQALAVLKATAPELVVQTRLLIVGSAQSIEDKAYERSLHQLVVDSGLQDSVSFLPFSPDVRLLMRAADLFIHASTTAEPFGLVVAEAMLGGALVLSNGRGGVSEVLKEGETGLTFNGEQNGAGNLATTVGHVLNTLGRAPAEYDAMKTRARTLIEQRHDPRRICMELESLYES